MPYKECFYTFIYTSCLLLFAWPLYIYLIKEWYSHRDHFVIRNRWPKITMIVIISTIIMQLIIFIEAAFCIYTLRHIPIGMSNAVTGLVYYRSYLLYAATMKARHCMRKREKSQTALFENENKKRLFSYRNIARAILVTVCITSICIPVLRYLIGTGATTFVPFTITLCIGIFCVVNIIRAKVRDSIGITKECIIQISINFAMLFLTRFSEKFVPSYINANSWFGFIASICCGLCSLVIAYNLTKKVEKLKVDKRKKLPQESPVSPRGSSFVDEHKSTGLNIPKHGAHPSSVSISLPPSPPLQLRDTESLKKWLQKPLVHFLHGNPQNLSLFIGYLSECFALENILFLERALILYRLIKKYKTMDAQFDAETNGEYHAFTYLCYKLKFTFLTQIYGDIEVMIENGWKDNEAHDGEMKYKRGIIDAMKSIYFQFCSTESDMEINLAFDVRNKLYQLFEVKTDDEIMEQFGNYDDLLIVYHDAIMQCWNLCESIYGFQFRLYLRQKKEVKPEISLSLVEHDSAQNPNRNRINGRNAKDVDVDIGFPQNISN